MSNRNKENQHQRSNMMAGGINPEQDSYYQGGGRPLTGKPYGGFKGGAAHGAAAEGQRRMPLKNDN